MNPMFIAAVLAILAVWFVGLATLVASDSGGAISHGGALFKTGNPSLHGGSATLGVAEGSVELPATLEAGRKGVES